MSDTATQYEQEGARLESGGGSAPKKKKKKGGFVFCMVVLIPLLLALFAIGFFMARNDNPLGNFILFVSGGLELAVAFIGFQIFAYRERHICPECGTKRIHHREWVQTTERRSNTNRSSVQGVQVSYTHEYLDTYICPACGETMEERVRKNGGTYKAFNDGSVQDNRRAPREF